MANRALQSAAAEPEPVVAVTLIHVIEAGQRLIVDRVELALIQTQEAFKQAMVDTAILLAAGAALAGAWVALNYAVVDLVGRRASSGFALICCMAIHALLGASLLTWRLRRRANQVER
jgi:hypothetical protein